MASKTRVIELCNQFGGRVAVCPDWNGRVMTSTSDGLDGNSYGLINVHEIDRIEDGENAYFFGGEDQFTLSPEGGPFSLYYAVDPEQRLLPGGDPIQIPNGFQEGIFSIDTVPPDPEVRMRRSFHMTNVAGARFDLDVVRTVKLLESKDIAAIFGHPVAVSLEQGDVSYVGFSTINSIVNCGIAHSKSSGLVSVRIRSMFNSGQNTVAVIPYREGDKDELGPCVCTDFFGTAPHGRARLLPQAALLRADSKYRCQIGVSRRRALSSVGSIDFREGILTLQTFNLPQEPWLCNYLCNEYCETVSNTVADFVNAREFYLESLAGRKSEQTDLKALPKSRCEDDSPYAGEVVRAYNHGPSVPGEMLSCFFYEFDFYSQAQELVRGESLTHFQYTLHINADNRTLAFLSEKILGVDYEKVYEKMMR